jgi:hypothetical protein
LALPDAITQAPRYNLAAIETGENARMARRQRLLALSELLRQVRTGDSEKVGQISLSTSGFEKDTRHFSLRLDSKIGCEEVFFWNGLKR